MLSYEPIDYIVRVPDAIEMDGLDADRWLHVYPPYDGNALEAHPIPAREASELFARYEVGIGTIVDPEVQDHLRTLAAPARRGAASETASVDELRRFR